MTKLFKTVLKNLERNDYVKICERKNAMERAKRVIKKNSKSAMS